MKKVLILCMCLALTLTPAVTQASGTYKVELCDDANDNHRCDPSENIESTETAEYEGIVPCGDNIDVNGTSMTVPCQFCHLFIMLKGVIDFLLLPPDGLIFIGAILMLVVGGLMYMFAYLSAATKAGAKPQLLSQANKLITSVLIGLAICFASWMFVNTFFLFIGVADWTGFFDNPDTPETEEWFQINCPVKIPHP